MLQTILERYAANGNVYEGDDKHVHTVMRRLARRIRGVRDSLSGDQPGHAMLRPAVGSMAALMPLARYLMKHPSGRALAGWMGFWGFNFGLVATECVAAGPVTVQLWLDAP